MQLYYTHPVKKWVERTLLSTLKEYATAIGDHLQLTLFPGGDPGIIGGWKAVFIPKESQRILLVPILQSGSDQVVLIHYQQGCT